tara:strand:- start:1214 stop:1681 length:468 start_codon:yes stop_codon:yes gene_type:complete
MIAELSAAFAALKAVNDGIQSLRDAHGHGRDLGSILGSWSEAAMAAKEAEKVQADGKMSYQEALRLESVKRQVENMDRMLHDICLIQGQPDLYRSVKARMAEAEANAEKELARIKLRRKKRVQFWKELGQIAGITFVVFLLAIISLWAFFAFWYS